MSKRRYILIGFDGCNPEMVERFLPELPNFRHAIANGSWGPMLSTIPCDTPTNWTALATGATAATSGITGFASFVPGDSLRVERRPSRPNEYADLRKAEFIWEAADHQGYKTIMINYPFSWHSDELENGIIVGGDSISGHSKSSLRGSGCICTADRLDAIAAGATVVDLESDGSTYRARVPWGAEEARIWSAIGEVRTGQTVESGQERTLFIRTLPGGPATVSIEDSVGKTVEKLVLGQWSSYRDVRLGDEVGSVRFLLVHASKDGSSVQICHSKVTLGEGWTKPARYAPLLQERCGPFQAGEESGGALGHGAWGGDHTFEGYSGAFTRTGEIMVDYARELAREVGDWDQIYIQMHSSDGLNHWMLGHLDPNFLGATPASTDLAERMYLRNYQDTDYVLGQALKLAEEWDAALVAVADHSAVPTHTWVDTTKPFMEAGLIYFDEEGVWDPTRSKVRHMLNHSAYVNLQGRSPDGIVPEADYERVRDQTISILMNMRDPRTGACPIAIAARREDMDGVGGNGENFGDVIFLMRPGYTNQPASEGLELTEDSATSADFLSIRGLGAWVTDAKEGLSTGYTQHSRLQGNHHDYMPNAEWPGLCTNRAILLMYGPGIKSGHTIRNARTIDIAPTLAHYVGMQPPAQADGNVLMQVLES